MTGGIRFADRVAVFGQSGTGKSELARRLFLSVSGPRLVIDPAGSQTTKVPGAVTVRGPADTRATGDAVAQAVGVALEEHRSAPVVRFVPRDPLRLEEYHGAYVWAFSRFPRFTWLDEAGIAAPSTGGRWTRGLGRYLIQGRKRQLGHLAAHTRPVEIDRNVTAQAQHLFLFSLPNPDDRVTVAKTVGVRTATLDGLLAELPEYGFLHYDERASTLDVCDPLEL